MTKVGNTAEPEGRNKKCAEGDGEHFQNFHYLVYEIRVFIFCQNCRICISYFVKESLFLIIEICAEEKKK